MICEFFIYWVVSVIIGLVMFKLCCGWDYFIFDIIGLNFLYYFEKLLMECVEGVVFGLIDCIG